MLSAHIGVSQVLRLFIMINTGDRQILLFVAGIPSNNKKQLEVLKRLLERFSRSFRLGFRRNNRDETIGLFYENQKQCKIPSYLKSVPCPFYSFNWDPAQLDLQVFTFSSQTFSQFDGYA